jgi:hypothetical protein
MMMAKTSMSYLLAALAIGATSGVAAAFGFEFLSLRAEVRETRSVLREVVSQHLDLKERLAGRTLPEPPGTALSIPLPLPLSPRSETTRPAADAARRRQAAPFEPSDQAPVDVMTRAAAQAQRTRDGIEQQGGFVLRPQND